MARRTLKHIFAILLLAILFSLAMAMHSGNLTIDGAFSSYKEIVKGITQGSFPKTATGISAAQYLKTGLSRSAALYLFALLITLTLGVLIGFTWKAGTSDNTAKVSLVSIIMVCIPEIFLIIVLQGLMVILYRNGIKMFPVIAKDSVQGLFLPALSISLVPSVYIGRILRYEISHQMKQGYITFALSKGVKRRDLLVRHVAVNIFGPLTTSIRHASSILLSGMVVSEFMFAYPGLSYHMFNLIGAGEFTVALSLAIVLYVIYTLAVLMIEIVLEGVKRWTYSPWRI